MVSIEHVYWTHSPSGYFNRRNIHVDKIRILERLKTTSIVLLNNRGVSLWHTFVVTTLIVYELAHFRFGADKKRDYRLIVPLSDFLFSVNVV